MAKSQLIIDRETAPPPSIASGSFLLSSTHLDAHEPTEDTDDFEVASMPSTSTLTSNNRYSASGSELNGSKNAPGNGAESHQAMMNGLVSLGYNQPSSEQHQDQQQQEQSYAYGSFDQAASTMATLEYQRQQSMVCFGWGLREREREHPRAVTLIDCCLYFPLRQESTPSPSALDDNNNSNAATGGSLKNGGGGGVTGAEELSFPSSPSSTASGQLNISNQAQYKQTLEYLKQLFADRERLSGVPYGLFFHVTRLLDTEIQRVRASLIHIDGSADNRPPLVLPEPDGPVVTKSRKIFVPVEKYPDFNFIGRIIGPRGLTIRELQVDCGCNLYIRGRGSLRDKHKEEKLKAQPNWDHLNEDLHVLICVEDAENRADLKLERAESEINKLLESVISNKDEFKMRQLAELAILNDKFKSQNKQAQQQMGAAAAMAAATANQLAVIQQQVAAGEQQAQQVAALQHMLSNASVVTGQAQSGPGNAAGQLAGQVAGQSPISHHAALSGQHVAAMAAAQAAAAAQLNAGHHHQQQQQAAAVAALQAANQSRHHAAALQAAALGQHHSLIQQHAQHQHQQSMALAAGQQAASVYQMQVNRQLLYNHHQQQQAVNAAAAAAAFAPAGLETAHGLLFAAQGMGSQALLGQDALSPLTAVPFPNDNNKGGNHRYRPYNNKKK